MSKFKNIFFNFKNRYWFRKYPSSFKIEITSKCNLKCIMCSHKYFEGPNIDMSLENFKGIIDRFPSLKLVDFTGLGENFLNKDFLKMLQYVKSKKIKAIFNSNFYFIDKKVAEELIELGVDEITASIDGATKKTYEKIRVGSDFEKIINNVEIFFNLRKKNNKKLPVIIFNYVINKYNFSEINEFVRLINSLAMGQKTVINFSSVFPAIINEEFEKLKISYNHEILKDNIQKTINTGKELGISIVHSYYGLPQPSIDRCPYHFVPFIITTGEVIPCCVARRLNLELEEIISGNLFVKNLGKDIFRKKIEDILKEISLGNIFKKSFKEIWHGKEYRNFRKMLRHGKTPSFCKNCPLYKINV